MAGAGIPRFLRLMLQASGAESVEGLQSLDSRCVTLQGSCRVAVTGVRMPRLNFVLVGAVLLKHPHQNR